MKQLPIDLRPEACILAAFMVLLVPLDLVSAFFVAAALHELGHLAAAKLCGVRVIGIRIGVVGAKIQLASMDIRAELICSLAGPVAGLLTVMVQQWFPLLTVVAWIQSVCNLLPVYPLDGGRIWRCLLALFFGERWAQRVGGITDFLCTVMILLAGIIGFWRFGMGIFSICVPTILVLRWMLRKIPCKSGDLGLQ